MSGRGRGRGRGGIPISYPDGTAAKPANYGAPYPDLQPPLGEGMKSEDGLPPPLPITANNWNLLRVRREMTTAPAFAPFRVSPAVPDAAFERYSDRYTRKTQVPFAQSKSFFLRKGHDFYPELSSAIGKRRGAGRGRGRVRENLRLGDADVLLDDADEGEEGEDADKEERGGVKERDEGEEGGEEDADDDDEEDDLLSEGDQGFDEGFEDGGDDIDDGGDDEPTY
tara:strand:- start:87 stop:761 length:675 start_codon:yes stop_codon:yes gene_type:complete